MAKGLQDSAGKPNTETAGTRPFVQNNNMIIM